MLYYSHKEQQSTQESEVKTMDRHLSKEQEENLQKIISLTPIINEALVSYEPEKGFWKVFHYINEIASLARDIKWEG